MSSTGALVGALLLAVPAFAWAAAPAGVSVAPMHSLGAKAAFPRLVQFPDAKMMKRVNAILADREKQDRAAYADCLSMLKDSGMKPDNDTYSEEISVRYVSSRYLSVEVMSSYFCAAAYPTNGAETPLTIDLSSGQTVDWTKQFKPGFLPSSAADEHAPPSALTRLYRARYSKAADDAECRTAINEQDPFSGAPIVWMDSRGGIVVQPDFPHVMAACGTPMTLSPADMAPYLKDAKLLADLKATVKPAPK